VNADNLQVQRAIFVLKHPTCYDVKGVWVSEGTTLKIVGAHVGLETLSWSPSACLPCSLPTTGTSER